MSQTHTQNQQLRQTPSDAEQTFDPLTAWQSEQHLVSIGVQSSHVATLPITATAPRQQANIRNRLKEVADCSLESLSYPSSRPSRISTPLWATFDHPESASSESVAARAINALPGGYDGWQVAMEGATARIAIIQHPFLPFIAEHVERAPVEPHGAIWEQTTGLDEQQAPKQSRSALVGSQLLDPFYVAISGADDGIEKLCSTLCGDLEPWAPPEYIVDVTSLSTSADIPSAQFDELLPPRVTREVHTESGADAVIRISVQPRNDPPTAGSSIYIDDARNLDSVLSHVSADRDVPASGGQQRFDTATSTTDASTIPTIDLTITSPPYLDAIDYQSAGASGDWADVDADDTQRDVAEQVDTWVDLQREIFTTVFEHTTDGGYCVVVVGEHKQGDHLVDLPARLSLCLEEIGWTRRHKITWNKMTDGQGAGQFATTVQHNRPTNYWPNVLTETILVFRKGSKRESDCRSGDKIALTDAVKTNVANDIWQFTPVEHSQYNHPCPFPQQIVRALVTFFSKTGDVVLDPMAGSGTVPAVATHEDRVGLGIDTVSQFVHNARHRLTEAPYKRKKVPIVNYDEWDDATGAGAVFRQANRQSSPPESDTDESAAANSDDGSSPEQTAPLQGQLDEFGGS